MLPAFVLNQVEASPSAAIAAALTTNSATAFGFAPRKDPTGSLCGQIAQAKLLPNSLTTNDKSTHDLRGADWNRPINGSRRFPTLFATG
jgi:hypothetical protein